MADFGGKSGELTFARASSDEEKSAFVQIIEVLRRRLWILVTVVAIVLSITAFVTFTATKRFTAVSQVLLEGETQRVLTDADPLLAARPQQDKSGIDTEIAILSSPVLAARVVDALDLARDPEFVAPPKKAKGAAPITPTAQDKAIARQIAVGSLLQVVDINRVGNTYLVDVAVTSMDGQKAARIANEIVSQYMLQQMQAKYEAFEKANNYLSEQIRQLSDEVQRRERDVEDWREREGLLTAQGVRLTDQTTQLLNQQRVQQAEQLSRAEARLRALETSMRAGALADATPEALQSPVISALRAQQSALEQRRAEMQSRWDVNHPGWANIREESRSIETQIQAEIGRIIESLQEEVQIARQGLSTIDRQLSAQRGTLAAQNQGEVALRQKEREADAARELVNGLLARYREVMAQRDVENPDARQVSKAIPPLGPSSPKTKLNLLMGFVLGLFAGLVAILIVELLEQSLRTPEDVQARLGVPCIGQLPFLNRRTRIVDGEPLAPESFVLKRPLSAFGEALRNIRAAVFFASPDRKTAVVGVTSALPEEGKTTVAVSLARISGLAGSKVILVDCDLRRRSATHAIGIEAEKGLTEFLFRTATLDEVIQKDPESGIDVLPLAQAEFTSRDLFGSDAMRNLLDALRARYEIIVIDCAPILPLSDTRVLSTLCDTMLMVARWGKTPASVVRTAMNHMYDRGADISGVVLDGVENGMMSRLVYDRPDYYSELYQTYYIR
jgi:capsular exopolysaccharide synthesis family protein